MKPDQAIKILDNAVAQMSLNRESHIALVQAVEVLKALVAQCEPVAQGEQVENG